MAASGFLRPVLRDGGPPVTGPKGGRRRHRPTGSRPAGRRVVTAAEGRPLPASHRGAGATGTGPALPAALRPACRPLPGNQASGCLARPSRPARARPPPASVSRRLPHVPRVPAGLPRRSPIAHARSPPPRAPAAHARPAPQAPPPGPAPASRTRRTRRTRPAPRARAGPAPRPMGGAAAYLLCVGRRRQSVGAAGRGRFVRRLRCSGPCAPLARPQTPTRRPRRPRPAVMSQSESPGLQEESLHGERGPGRGARGDGAACGEDPQAAGARGCWSSEAQPGAGFGAGTRPGRLGRTRPGTRGRAA